MLLTDAEIESKKTQDFLAEYQALCKAHDLQFIALNGGEMLLSRIDGRRWSEVELEFCLRQDNGR